jgi:hypothetical protein
MPFKINIQLEDGSTHIKPLIDCADHGLLVLHHPETINLYANKEVADALRAVYAHLNLRSDWETWDMDKTPTDIPWAGTPTTSNTAWDNLFATTNPKISQALKAHALMTKAKKPPKKSTQKEHKNNTVNELSIFRHGDFFMHAFPRANRVPGEGLIRIAQAVQYRGTRHVIHPFFTDRRALVHTEALMEEVADIMVDSHTKDGKQFFLLTNATNSLPP